MADMDKVLKALELCASGCDNDGCVYLDEQNKRGGVAACRCVDLMARDALDMLKSKQAEIDKLKDEIAMIKADADPLG